MTEGRIRLGAEIQRRRKQLGLTQEELAQRMDVSRQSVTKWETGQSAPDLDRLVQLGEVLKISLDELLKGPSDNADDNWNENEGEHAARDSAEEPCLHADPAPVCRESAFPSSLSFFLRLTGGLLLLSGWPGCLPCGFLRSVSCPDSGRGTAVCIPGWKAISWLMAMSRCSGRHWVPSAVERSVC